MLFQRKQILGWLALAASSTFLMAPSTESRSHATSTYLRRSLIETLDRAGDEGDRVSDILSNTDRECLPVKNDAWGLTYYTPITYFYTIQSNSPITDDKKEELEDLLYMIIQSAILWCTLPDYNPVVDISRSANGDRKLREFLTSEKCKFFLDKKKN